MPTSKKRLNVTLDKDTALFLRNIALRDDVPQATKAAELIEKALELEEDEYFAKVAMQREKKNGKYISHEEFWSKVL
jgi:predicted DNA-binding protein